MDLKRYLLDRLRKKAALLLCLGMAGLGLLLQPLTRTRAPADLEEQQEVHVVASPFASSLPKEGAFNSSSPMDSGDMVKLPDLPELPMIPIPEAPPLQAPKNARPSPKSLAPPKGPALPLPALPEVEMLPEPKRKLDAAPPADVKPPPPPLSLPEYIKPPVTKDSKDAGPEVAAPRPHDSGDPLPPIPEVPFLPELPGEQGPPALEQLGQPKQIPLDRPLESDPEPGTELGPVLGALPSIDAPLGFSGRSSVIPRDSQTDPRFVPIEDRWRIGFPSWDRYGKGHPPVDDYPYVEGRWYDPYNQNVLKGDYPIIGQHIFLVTTATSKSLVEPRQVPIGTTPFESTERPGQEQLFGRPHQLAALQFFILSFDLFHGDAGFKPMDWRFKVTPIFNINYIGVDERAVVNPDVRRGTDRMRTFLALEEWFAEIKLADLGPNYDFVSLRAGSQLFNSDFRGFIFSDINRGVRLFGNRNSNRQQFNLAYFNQLEKDTNSELNTFQSRDQQVVIGNFYLQDFIWPGYTAQFSFHYNRDEPSFKFDKNDNLVRPDPAGRFLPHGLDVAYLGWAGDGHINRFNINHAFYLAVGHDSLNPIANEEQDILAQMAALEVSYDRDWIRFRSSFFWASGDDDPRNSHATGFDAIFDNPNFAGGEFSYWQRQAIRLLGVNLTNRGSLLPNLRSSKIQGQSNFVNPGLFLTNFGMDFEVSPRFRVITNTNLLWFENTAVLKQFVYQSKVDQFIGVDLSMGAEYRPFLNNNVIIKGGVSSLLPGDGFHSLYDNLRDRVEPHVAAFIDVVLTF